MCIAIYQPKDKPKLSKDRLRICDINNPHGAGLAYVEAGKLFIKKGYFDFEEFWKAYEAVPEGCPTILHFRIATSGNKDAENCHPWSINENACIVHNGVMSDFADDKSQLSDTGNFVKFWLNPAFTALGDKAYKIPFIKYAIFKALQGDRAIILDKDGEVYIFNDDVGVYEDGIWYSNKSYVSLKGSNSSKGAAKTEAIYFTSNHKRRYAYIQPGGEYRALTSQEVNALIKKHHNKLKKLVKAGIVARIELTKDNKLPALPSEYGEGQPGLDAWLKKNAAQHN